MRFVVGLFLLVFLTAAIIASAHAEDPRKEYLRLQATEFCAVVGKPPAALAEALNNAVKQDPKTWLPAIAWWNAIAERYDALKCGDA